MRGHESILKFRHDGYKPIRIFITEIIGDPRTRGFMDPEGWIALGSFPEIVVGESDTPELLDLRCVHGVSCHIAGIHTDRVRAIANRARHFLPSEIFVILPDEDKILRWRAKQ